METSIRLVPFRLQSRLQFCDTFLAATLAGGKSTLDGRHNDEGAGRRSPPQLEQY